jgi:hypothetical protein
MGTHCGILYHRTCLASARYSAILVALYALDMLLTMFASTVFYGTVSEGALDGY